MALVVKPSSSEARHDRMSVFYKRVCDFNYAAPLRHWKMDAYLEALSIRRDKSFDVLAVRKKVWRSAYISSLRDNYVHNEQPVITAEAKDFLSKLDVVRTILSELRVNPEEVSRVMVHVPPDDQVLPYYERQEAGQADIQGLLGCLGKTELEITEFLDKNFLPQSSSSNRADHFIRTFAENSAIAWRSAIASQLERRRDRGDFAGLLVYALDDFGYPRVGNQVGSDNWLYQRIGKYDIWK